MIETPSPTPLSVYIISDSSGETAAHVAQAALVQFPSALATLHRLPQVRSSQDIEEMVSRIAGTRALIAYTLVVADYRDTLKREAQRHGIPILDVLSPLLSKISELTQTPALFERGRLHLLDDAYFRRIEAVNFAVHYDDGKDTDRISQADVVLLGLSRTSKTPNCMYLAQQYGLKAANIPIVVGVDLPLALFQIPRHKVVGLNIDPFVLQGVRMSRAQTLGVAETGSYSDLDEIKHEVQYAKRIFRELKCHVIDVSARAIEETSSEIFLYINSQRTTSHLLEDSHAGN